MPVWAVGSVAQENLLSDDGGSFTTICLSQSRQSVLDDELSCGQNEPLTICAKPGGCPCEAPCAWGEQVLDDVRQDVWPVLVRPLQVILPTDTRD